MYSSKLRHNPAGSLQRFCTILLGASIGCADYHGNCIHCSILLYYAGIPVVTIPVLSQQHAIIGQDGHNQQVPKTMQAISSLH
jgi:hypothetical protein